MSKHSQLACDDPTGIDGWEYDGWECRVISIANLLTQDGLCYYVWPYEGQFKNGKWTFHKGKVLDGEHEIDAPDKPLLVDVSSARAFKAVWKAVNDKNKGKLTEYAQSRGLFCWAMDKLVWANVRFGG